MKTLLVILTVFGLLSCGVVLAEEETSLTEQERVELSQAMSRPGDDLKAVDLVDLPNRKLIPVERDANGKLKLLPWRLYRRYEPKVQHWVYDLTANEPAFDDPPGFLLAGSCLSGEWVGSTNDVTYVFEGAIPAIRKPTGRPAADGVTNGTEGPPQQGWGEVLGF